MKAVADTLKLHSVSGSREGRWKTQADGTPTEEWEWKLCVACMPCVCRSCRGKVHDQCPFIDIRNEREIWASEYKAQQHQKTSEDQALFAAASRILELGERENLTVCKLVKALRH